MIATPSPESLYSRIMRRGPNLTKVSFGSTSAIVTSMGLIAGFGAAGVSKPPIVAGLLILGLADNITDSLSIHIYQESERLAARPAFRATLSNFAARFVVSISFTLLVFALPARHVVLGSLAWGASLLIGLTWLLARSRKTGVVLEVCKHLAAAVVVIAVSRAIGTVILVYVH